jgi:hypothetical protein
MARDEEPFLTLLNRTIRNRWPLMVKVILVCFAIIVTVVALLPPSHMAVGLVRVGYLGPGYGILSLNTVATEAGSTGFVERVKKEVGAEDADMVARVRFKSNLVELRAYAATPELATQMVRTAGDWMVQEHENIIHDVFAGGKALYLERFGRQPSSEELIFQRTSIAFETMEEVKSVKPGLLPTAFLSLFLGFFLGLVLIIYRELTEQDLGS